MIGEGFSLFPGILVFSEFWVKRDFGVVARVRDLFCFVFRCWAFRFNCVTGVAASLRRCCRRCFAFVAAVASRLLPPLLRVCCRGCFAFVIAVGSNLTQCTKFSIVDVLALCDRGYGFKPRLVHIFFSIHFFLLYLMPG